jgi:hypothetical protein
MHRAASLGGNRPYFQLVTCIGRECAVGASGFGRQSAVFLASNMHRLHE